MNRRLGDAERYAGVVALGLLVEAADGIAEELGLPEARTALAAIMAEMKERAEALRAAPS